MAKKRVKINNLYLNDFDGSLGNLGRDVQSLEEGGLLGTQPGVLGWHDDVKGSQCSGTGRGSNLVSQEHVPDGDQLLLGENESNVSLDVVEKLLELGVVGQVSADGLAHHGVLAHEDDGMAAERHADLLHLLGSDIVGVDLKDKKCVKIRII